MGELPDQARLLRVAPKGDFSCVGGLKHGGETEMNALFPAKPQKP